MTESDNSSQNQLLPGMAAVSLWMLVLSLLGVVGILSGHYATVTGRIGVLVLSTLFATAGLGLIRRRRWGWALCLGSAFLSTCFAFFGVFHWHQTQWIVMGAVNLVFFLYLVRPEITTRLK
jgi:hypothetical protein